MKPPTYDDSRINETTSLNPPGRDMVGRNRKKEKFKLLKLKKDYIVPVLNVGTVKRTIKKEELKQRFSKNRIDILGIVDHKNIHDDPIEYYEKQNVTFITTSATKNANNAQIRGLGLLINRTLSAALAQIKPHNSRIFVAHFNENPATTSIIHYAPIEGTTEAIDHYEHFK